jgi:hypothetical protein
VRRSLAGREIQARRRLVQDQELSLAVERSREQHARHSPWLERAKT